MAFPTDWGRWACIQLFDREEFIESHRPTGGEDGKYFEQHEHDLRARVKDARAGWPRKLYGWDELPDQ